MSLNWWKVRKCVLLWDGFKNNLVKLIALENSKYSDLYLYNSLYVYQSLPSVNYTMFWLIHEKIIVEKLVGKLLKITWGKWDRGKKHLWWGAGTNPQIYSIVYWYSIIPHFFIFNGTNLFHFNAHGSKHQRVIWPGLFRALIAFLHLLKVTWLDVLKFMSSNKWHERANIKIV